MNNSQAALEPVLTKIDPRPKLRQREETLVKLIKALEKTEQSEEWSTLKTELFDGIIKRFEYELLDEARKPIPNSHTLANLTGQLESAERYDLTKVSMRFRLELKHIKQQLYGTT